MTPRPYTADEVRERFLDHVRSLAVYWAGQQDQTPLERCEGVAFSILNIFDGTTGLPAMNISLAPHTDDRAYQESNGENWYEPDQIINDCYLHELFYREPKHGHD